MFGYNKFMSCVVMVCDCHVLLGAVFGAFLELLLLVEPGFFFLHIGVLDLHSSRAVDFDHL